MSASRIQYRALLTSALGALIFSALLTPSASGQNIINSVAGSWGPTGGTAVNVGVETTSGVVLDNSGNIYFAASALNRVYKVAPTGAMSLVAGDGEYGFAGDGGPATSAEIWQPMGLAVDKNGNIFIADDANWRVRRVDSVTGIITTVAGGGNCYPSTGCGDGGPATLAGLDSPNEVALDSSGNLFIADTNDARIRRVDAVTGIITTVAGTGTWGFSGDGGPATSAELSFPEGVAVDNAGNLFIGDTGNARVRRVDAASGVITTVAGDGTFGFSGDGGPATSAELNSAVGVALDSSSNLFLADWGNSRIRRVDGVTGIITTLAGTGVFGFGGDGGPASGADLNNPYGDSIDATGNVFIGDTWNYRIRRVDAASGIITTVAGNGTVEDGGPATNAVLDSPYGVAVDPSGNLFIADYSNSRIRRVDVATGIISTVAGNGTYCYPTPTACGDGGSALNAELDTPTGAAVDTSDDIFIGDINSPNVRRVDGISGTITAIAGNGTFGDAGDGGPATSAELESVWGLGLDSSDNLYIAANGRIRRVDAVTGIITTAAGNGVPGFSGDGGPATGAQLNDPRGVAVDASGNLYIADTANFRIRRVDATTGIITTVAGNGTCPFSGDGGPAVNAGICSPDGVAVDSAGNLFIAETGDDRVRRVDAATQTITTVAGNGTGGFHGDGGPATSAGLYVSGVAIDSASNLYIADYFNNRIRSVHLSPAAEVLPTSLTFSAQLVGTTSPPQPITLTNTGLATLSITSITLASNSTGFAETNTCGASLAPALTCNINVTFSPTWAGAFSGTITATYGAAGSPQTIFLTGTATGPAITLSTLSLTFPTQLVGTTSPPQTVTVTSSGTEALTITSISKLGGSFLQKSTCPISPSTLAVGATCGITVAFKATTPGGFLSYMTIYDNAAYGPQWISAAADATSAVKLVPTSLAFGSVPVGQSSAIQKVALTNVSNQSLLITSIMLGGSNPYDFSQRNNCPSTILAGASCSIQVQFKPLDAGARSATIMFLDTGSGSPQYVVLSGTGI